MALTVNERVTWLAAEIVFPYPATLPCLPKLSWSLLFLIHKDFRCKRLKMCMLGMFYMEVYSKLCATILSVTVVFFSMCLL